jgi:amino acid permease
MGADSPAEATGADGESKRATGSPKLPAGLSVAKIIARSNADFLEKSLAPQLIKNEKLKRKHKEVLLRFLKVFLVVQSIFLGLIVVWVIFSTTVSFEWLKASENPFIHYDFLKFYITAVVAEVLGMIYYIVKKVFDTTITSLADKSMTNSKKRRKKKKKKNEKK